MDKKVTWIVLIYLIIVIIILLCTSGCASRGRATRALLDAGFKNIKITGHRMFACSPDDWYHTAFEATNANGRKVKGTVCGGLIFKNSTIRYK